MGPGAGRGASGLSPRDILEVFLALSICTSLLIFCLRYWNSLAIAVLVRGRYTSTISRRAFVSRSSMSPPRRFVVMLKQLIYAIRAIRT